jgi:hypothetical protein
MDMEHLCPGIRQTVEWLQSEGFNTTDSGDGVGNEGMECAIPFPNVFMTCSEDILIQETKRLQTLLAVKGIEVQPLQPDDPQPAHIEASYDPSTGLGIISLFNVDDALLFGV